MLRSALFQATLDAHQTLRRRVSDIVEDFCSCKDPLSAMGRLFGVCRAVRDRSQQLQAIHSDGMKAFSNSSNGVLDGLANAWRQVLSAEVEPVLSVPLANAVLPLVDDLANQSIDIGELRQLLSV